MDSPSAPEAPDYRGAAEQTAAGNLELARYTTGANRINQYTPWGNQTYSNTQTFDTDGYNRAMSDWTAAGSDASKRPDRNAYMRDNWSQTVSLTPQTQNALNDQFAIQEGRSDAARDLLGNAREAYSQDFDPVRLNDYLGGVRPIDQSSLGRAGNFRTNASIDTSFDDTSRDLNTSFGRFGDNGSRVNTNAPAWDKGRADEYTKAAYEAQMSLLRPEMEASETKLRNSLAIQGLGYGTEANTGAMDQFSDARSRQLSQLAAQSVLTGNDLSNRDYASQLAGFQADNAAEGQRFGQNLTGFQTNMSAAQGENAARGQDFSQQLQSFTANNGANLQQLGLDQARYDNQLRGLTTNAQLRGQENQTQQQAYAQALQNYATQWQQDQTLRNMPLNELNALLTGQQVQNPTFNNYAMQNQTQGANYADAMSQQGAWNQGIFNQQAAGAAQNNSALGGLAGTAAMMFMMSDKRLKKNIEKVGETEGGSNVYSWDWNAKGKQLAGNAPTVGVLAQEHPEAARKTSSGFLAVDYSKIK